MGRLAVHTVTLTGFLRLGLNFVDGGLGLCHETRATGSE